MRPRERRVSEFIRLSAGTHKKSSHSVRSPVHDRGRKQIFHFSALESDMEMGYYGLSNDPSAHQVT